MNVNGYYQVGNRNYFNKVDAIKESITTHKPVHWNFNDSEFSKLDWTLEPNLSLRAYYIKRAIYLRNKYQYLVLHYSGGSDSNQVLQSFIDAGVTIDEVVIRTLVSTTAVDLSNTAATNVFGGYPIAVSNALYVKNTFWPRLKISEIVVNEAVRRISSNTNWLSQTTGSLGMFDTWKEYDILTRTDKLSAQGIAVGHILGIDKPRIYIDSVGWHVKFLDKIPGVHVTARSQIEEDFNLEFFFWDKTCPEIVCKQAHILVRAATLGLLSVDDLSGASRAHQKKRAELLYNYKFDTWAEEKPQLSGIVRDAEQIFYSNPTSAFRVNWEKTLTTVHSEITESAPHFWHSTKYDGLCGFWSTSYYIKFLKGL